MMDVTMRFEGSSEAIAKFAALTDRREQRTVLKASVREPMKDVMKKALINISRFSPGAKAMHKTYRGRLVAAGFAARSVRMITVIDKASTSARAILGVRKEAFYALQFWELGTAYLKAVPWLQPAFYSSKEDSVRKVGQVMLERIERIAKRRVANAA